MQQRKDMLDKLIKKQNFGDLINTIISADFAGNRKQFAEENGVDLAALSHCVSVMDSLLVKPWLYVLTPDQVKKIKRYVETLESLIE